MEPDRERWRLVRQLVAAVMCAMLLGASNDSHADALEIAGRVTDASGSGVPGVSVMITPETGGLSRETTTRDDGRYTFDGLPDATYRVDFELSGFELTRINHVGRKGQRIVDVALKILPVCECITLIPTASDAVVRTGQVTTSQGVPLPHARVEVVTPAGPVVTRADRDGRFAVQLPPTSTWSITASDSGFDAATSSLSGGVVGPLVLRLPYRGTANVPEREVLNAACGCPSVFVATP